MDKASGKLTVYFEEPFWVGVFERIEDGKLSVAKVTFGAEPKDYEVQEYIQKYYFSLKFSPAVETVVKDIKRNPKRMQREVKKMLKTGIGTKSQQALKLQQEQNKPGSKCAEPLYLTASQEGWPASPKEQELLRPLLFFLLAFCGLSVLVFPVSLHSFSWQMPYNPSLGVSQCRQSGGFP